MLKAFLKTNETPFSVPAPPPTSGHAFWEKKPKKTRKMKKSQRSMTSSELFLLTKDLGKFGAGQHSCYCEH